VGNVEQYAFRFAIQMIGCGDTSWQPVEQGTTNAAKRKPS